jgi:hypothetical protein
VLHFSNIWFACGIVVAWKENFIKVSSNSCTNWEYNIDINYAPSNVTSPKLKTIHYSCIGHLAITIWSELLVRSFSIALCFLFCSLSSLFLIWTIYVDRIFLLQFKQRHTLGRKGMVTSYNMPLSFSFFCAKNGLHYKSKQLTILFTLVGCRLFELNIMK